jgi:hypothetical protein
MAGVVVVGNRNWVGKNHQGMGIAGRPECVVSEVRKEHDNRDNGIKVITHKGKGDSETLQLAIPLPQILPI